MHNLEKLHRELYKQLFEDAIDKGYLTGWEMELEYYGSDVDEDIENQELNIRIDVDQTTSIVENAYEITVTLSELIDVMLRDIRWDLSVFLSTFTLKNMWFIEDEDHVQNTKELQAIIDKIDKVLVNNTDEVKSSFIKNIFTLEELNAPLFTEGTESMLFRR